VQIPHENAVFLYFSDLILASFPAPFGCRKNEDKLICGSPDRNSHLQPINVLRGHSQM